MPTLAAKFTQQFGAWARHFSMSPAALIFAVILVFAFLSGVQAHLMPSVYPITQRTTDFLLLGVCLPILYFIYNRQQDNRLFWWVSVTYIGTFFIEAAGVATG